jgi:hypothetical protein
MTPCFAAHQKREEIEAHTEASRHHPEDPRFIELHIDHVRVDEVKPIMDFLRQYRAVGSKK